MATNNHLPIHVNINGVGYILPVTDTGHRYFDGVGEQRHVWHGITYINGAPHVNYKMVTDPKHTSPRTMVFSEYLKVSSPRAVIAGIETTERDIEKNSVAVPEPEKAAPVEWSLDMIAKDPEVMRNLANGRAPSIEEASRLLAPLNSLHDHLADVPMNDYAPGLKRTLTGLEVTLRLLINIMTVCERPRHRFEVTVETDYGKVTHLTENPPTWEALDNQYELVDMNDVAHVIPSTASVTIVRRS